MVALVLRTLGVGLLALALVAIAFDAAQSIALAQPKLMAIGTAVETALPRNAAALEAGLRNRIGGTAFDGVVQPFLMLPASVVATAAGFVLLFLGAGRRRRARPAA